MTMNTENQELDYRCIECGNSAQDLCKDLKAGVIKITHCDGCQKVVDKYIEFDNMVIFLDALLHKPQAYRHLLFNIHIQSPWKLLLILLLCDTYLKWANLHDGQGQSSDAEHKMEDSIFYAAVEWDFYRMFLVALVEWLVFSCSVWCLVFFFFSTKSSSRKTSRTRTLMTGLTVSSFGKLLAIPAIIWGQTHSAIYLLLTQVFIFTSNVTALKVLCSCSRLTSLAMIGAAFFLRSLAGSLIQSWLVS